MKKYKYKTWLGLLLLTILFNSSLYAADTSVTLHKSVHFETDNWYPLPEAEMKRAVTDTAFSVLTQNATISIVDDTTAGRIDFYISLIGPAETAKATIEIHSQRTDSMVSTASISLRNMDYQDIFHAFEHIGREAAERMVVQVQSRLGAQADAPNSKITGATNKQLQALFDKASALKRATDFEAAKDLYLRISQYDGEQAGNWPTLAADEIRYGLPIFHARYLVYGGGRFTVNPKNLLSNLGEAENLLRQIYAENAGSAKRVSEAQAMLDNIKLAKMAHKRAQQANSLNQMTPLRMMALEYVYSRGDCPDKQFFEQSRGYISEDIVVDEVSGTEEKRSYWLSSANSGLKVKMVCDTENYPKPVNFILD